MFTLLDEQRARKFWEEEISRESEAIGISKGEAIGISKGEAIGISKGEAIGITKGEAIGENRVNALIARLVSMNRFDDIKRCTEDPEYRNKLYKEFKLA